jgi:hypothetical protein
MRLRYGMNPQQATACATPVMPDDWPVRVVHGQPSLINMLDALGAWQLVREAGQLLGRAAAASFKHTSPAGAALAGPVDEVAAGPYRTDGHGISGVTSAYLRARDADLKSSYGDFAAVSSPVDADLARLLARVVCDGIIAPGYVPGTVTTLSRKKNGQFLIMEADTAFTPPPRESREVFGVRLTQDRDDTPLSPGLLQISTGPALTEAAVSDLLLGMAVLRYTQSNSVCYVRDGMTLGIGAGQQSRVDCTRLAGAKTDTWWLRRHPAIRDLPLHIRPHPPGETQLAGPPHRSGPDPARTRSPGAEADRARRRTEPGPARRVAPAPDRGGVRLRRPSSLPRQRRSRPPSRRHLYRRARRVDPLRRDCRRLRRIRHHPRPHRPQAVPPLRRSEAIPLGRDKPKSHGSNGPAMSCFPEDCTDRTSTRAAADHRGDDAALTISSGTRAAPHDAGIRVRRYRVPWSARRGVFVIGHAARAAMAKAGGPTGYTLMLGGEERDVRSRSLRARL